MKKADSRIINEGYMKQNLSLKLFFTYIPIESCLTRDNRLQNLEILHHCPCVPYFSPVFSHFLLPLHIPLSSSFFFYSLSSFSLFSPFFFHSPFFSSFFPLIQSYMLLSLLLVYLLKLMNGSFWKQLKNKIVFQYRSYQLSIQKLCMDQE